MIGIVSLTSLLFWELDPAARDSDEVSTKVVDLNARDEFGRTRLHYAALKGDVRGIKLLLDAGADMHAQDNVGWTPLDIAQKCTGHQGVIALLSKNKVPESSI